MKMMKRKRMRILTYLEIQTGMMATTQRYACYNFTRVVTRDVCGLFVISVWNHSNVLQPQGKLMLVPSGCVYVTFRTQASRLLPMSWQPESKVKPLIKQKEIAHVSHCHYQPTRSISSHFEFTLHLLFLVLFIFHLITKRQHENVHFRFK